MACKETLNSNGAKIEAMNIIPEEGLFSFNYEWSMILCDPCILAKL